MFKKVLSFLNICALAALFTTSLAWAKPAEEVISIVVKPDTVVDAREVTLADVAIISMSDEALSRSLSKLVVMRTPRVGYAEQVTREGLEQLIKAQFSNTKWTFLWSGARFAKVYSASQIINTQKLIDVAVSGVQRQLIDRFDSIEVQAASMPHEVSVPPGDVTFQIRPIDARQIYARMPVWIDIMVNGMLYRSTVVSLALRTEHTVLVARRNLQEGSVATAEDFEVRKEDVTGINDSLIGKNLLTPSTRLKKSLVQGQILTQKYLQPRGAVLRGDWVKLIYADQAIVLETRALAAQEGQIGELIKVRLDKGNENIAGRIVSSGVVEIQGR